MNEAGFIDLECATCRCLYSVRHPNLDEIEYPKCPSCRNKPAQGCSEEDDDYSRSISRAD